MEFYETSHVDWIWVEEEPNRFADCCDNYAHTYWNRPQIDRSLPRPKPNLPVKFREIPYINADTRDLTS